MKKLLSVVCIITCLLIPTNTLAAPKVSPGSAFYGLRLGIGNFLFKYLNKEVHFKFGFEVATTNLWQALKIPKTTSCRRCGAATPTGLAAFTQGYCAQCFSDKGKLNQEALKQWEKSHAVAQKVAKESRKVKTKTASPEIQEEAQSLGAEQMWVYDPDTKSVEIYVFKKVGMSDRQIIAEAFAVNPSWGRPSDYQIYVQHMGKLPALHIVPEPKTTPQILSQLVVDTYNKGYEISQMVLHVGIVEFPKVLVGIGVIGGLDLLRRIMQMCVGLPPI